jgi:hypothetical protein
MAACFFIWFALVAGFALYFIPQPRLSVRGYWSLWVYAKLLILMTITTVLQLILCPHFALVHFSNENPFRFFESVTAEYMRWGGMSGCMFLCGLTFSSLGALVAFSFMGRHFSFSRPQRLLAAVGIGLLAQLPIMVLQLSSPAGQPYFLFWLLGSAIGLGLMGIVFKLIGEKVFAR